MPAPSATATNVPAMYCLILFMVIISLIDTDDVYTPEYNVLPSLFDGIWKGLYRCPCSHSSMEEQLQEYGLSEKEADVYLACLKMGPSTANRISSATDLRRSTTYDILESLKAKGLISSFIREKKYYFQAADPSELLAFMHAKEEKLKQILPQLERIKATVTGRPKHIYSVYRKMERKQCSFEEIYDLTALRIITKTVKDCYEVIGVMHSMWRPVPKEFDDYIAMPKPNLYQSLHTAVIGPEGKPIEIQVRTEDMHATAEEGIAAHWSYKGVHGDLKFDNQLSWLKQILEWQRESKDSKEFMDMLKVDFFEDEVFSFTPKGQVIELPRGACILDFAYAVHSGIGDKCVGGKVNGRFVPLRTLIKNGDVIEILTTNSQKPSREWLKFVRTPKARQKIKQVLRECTDIPIGKVSFVRPEKKELEQWVIETNLPNVTVKLSKCCNPLPGDRIVGYFVAGHRVSVHKVECANYRNLKQKMKKADKRIREVDVKWADNPNTAVEFYVEAVNRVGLFAEILNTIVATQTAIKSAKAKMISSVLVECRFSLDSRGLAHLQDIVKRVGKVKDVKNIYLAEVEE